MKKKISLILLLLTALPGILISSNYYWVGGSGNWSDYSNHWATSSGGNTFYLHLPYPNDNVYFDANSFTSANQTVNIDQTIVNCADMDWAGVTHNPILDGPYTNTLKIYGSLAFDAGMSLNFDGSVSFEATTTGKTITSSGKTFNLFVNFDGVGGAWTLQDGLSANTINLNSGTLTTNNHSVNAYSFNSNTSLTRSLNMGASIFTVNNGTGTPAWDVSSTGMTLNSGTSTIIDIGYSTWFLGGGHTYNNVNFTDTTYGGRINDANNTFNDVLFSGFGGIDNNNTFHHVSIALHGGEIGNNNIFQNITINPTCIIGDNNTFQNCTLYNNGNITGNNFFDTLTLSPGFTYTLTSGKTQIIVSELNAIGNGSYPIRLQSSTVGSLTTISKANGMVCADFVLISDNVASGGATFNAGVNSADLGGNSGWNFPGVCSSIGISQIENVNNISIYPNPSKDKLHFKNLEIKSKTYLTVENILGERVMEGELKDNEIRVAYLKPALYIIKIKNDEGISVGKFLKE